MLLVNKLNYYNVTHDIPDVVFRRAQALSDFASSKSIIRKKFEILTIKTQEDVNGDVVLVSSFLILNSFHTLLLRFSC